MPAEDKRRAPRQRHDSVLELYDEFGKLIVGIGKLVDFSMVGACFSTTKLLADGERVNARLRLLQEGVLDISAHVVWSRRQANATLYGIEFDLVRKARP
ncbi:MAG: PilZ domain-containing protein [Elusimicrobia bacterium]|nr:PilZ domain-containing protein [Elusimicrobiota bacterium]